MDRTFKATEINIGFHSDGFRIDKTASPMNLYTRWEITSEDKWVNPKPTCFDSLPQKGWRKIDSFDWDAANTT